MNFKGHTGSKWQFSTEYADLPTKASIQVCGGLNGKTYSFFTVEVMIHVVCGYSVLSEKCTSGRTLHRGRSLEVLTLVVTDSCKITSKSWLAVMVLTKCTAN